MNGTDPLTTFGFVMVETASGDGLVDFLVGARPDLERALVARFGLHDGMDAASSAVDYAYRHWPRLAAMENPAGYLYRVAITSARNVERRRRAEPLVADPVTVDVPFDIDLQRALARLKPEHRVAIVLVHAHGHTYAAAARILGLPVTTITNHLNRGLAVLRRLLEHRDDD